MKKRFLSIMMALCLALSLLPATALATEEETTADDEGVNIAADTTEYVAQVGEQTYTTLQDALTAEGDTITLLSDVSLTGTEVLNLTGKTIQTKGNTIYVRSGADVTIAGNGTVENDVVPTAKTEYHDLFVIESGGRLTIENGTFNTKSAQALNIVGTAIIEDGTFSCTASNVEIGSTDHTELQYSESKSMFYVAGGTLHFKNGAINAAQQYVPRDESAYIESLYGIYVTSGAKVTLGDEGSASGPSISSGYAALGLNNTTSNPPEISITIYGGTLEAGISADQTGNSLDVKQNAVMYISGAVNLEIYGGTFKGTNPKTDLITIPYKEVGAEVTISGGEFNATECDKVFYSEGTKAQGSGNNTLTITNGNFNYTAENFAEFADGNTFDDFITGGTFSSGVAKYVTAGRYSVGQENGTFTISETETEIEDDAGNYYVSDKAARAGSTASVTTEEGTTSYYTSLSAAIEKAKSGDTIDLWKDVTASNAGLSAYTDAVYKLPAGVTLDGHGNRIVADAENWKQISKQKTSNHILSVESGPNKTTIKNLTIIGVNESNKASKAGIHAYNDAVVDIENVNIEDCGSVGVQVNGATVTATGLNVSGSGWGSVNVDKGSAGVAPNFTFNSGNLEDDVQIYSENPEGTTIRVNDVSYQKVQGGDGDLEEKVYYTTDPAKLGEATVTKDGETTVYTDLDTALSSNDTSSGSTVTVVKDATLDSDATIVSGVTFVVDDNVKLTIADGKTLTNNGTIENNGTITGDVTTGESGKATAQVTFVTTPSNATVTVTGQGSGNTYNLPDGTYSYTVSANGCYSKTGSFTVNRNAQTITVKLEQIPTSSSGGSSSSEPSYSPVMDVSDGGSVKVNPRTPGEGDEVTITVDPDRGYEVGDVTVTDRNGRDVRVTAERDGTYTFEQPKGRVTIAVTFVREGTSTFFADVAETYWAYDEIAWAYENGYVNGVTATTFAPGASISRQQIWMILARIAGDDPADMAAARQWSIDNGISDGTNPGSAVTRQQLAALLFRFAQMMGYANEARVDLSSFPDAGSVASYAVEPMQWSVANSIVGGTTDGTLNPTGTATRAQFAVMLYRFWTGV